jgi:hypothetical protein
MRALLRNVGLPRNSKIGTGKIWPTPCGRGMSASPPIASELWYRREMALCANPHAGQQTAHHSMSWSARRRKDSEIVSPSALAVLRLITSENLVGCWTGRAEGLAPFKILST